MKIDITLNHISRSQPVTANCSFRPDFFFRHAEKAARAQSKRRESETRTDTHKEPSERKKRTSVRAEEHRLNVLRIVSGFFNVSPLHIGERLCMVAAASQTCVRHGLLIFQRRKNIDRHAGEMKN